METVRKISTKKIQKKQLANDNLPGRVAIVNNWNVSEIGKRASIIGHVVPSPTTLVRSLVVRSGSNGSVLLVRMKCTVGRKCCQCDKTGYKYEHGQGEIHLGVVDNQREQQSCQRQRQHRQIESKLGAERTHVRTHASTQNQPDRANQSGTQNRRQKRGRPCDAQTQPTGRWQHVLTQWIEHEKDGAYCHQNNKRGGQDQTQISLRLYVQLGCD